VQLLFDFFLKKSFGQKLLEKQGFKALNQTIFGESSSFFLFLRLAKR